MKTVVFLAVLVLFAGCSSAKSKMKSSEIPQNRAPEKKYTTASKGFKLCKENSLKKNIPVSDDARSIQQAVVADCKKEFSDYWMATMLKYRIQADMQNFEQAFLESLDQEIAQKLAKKNLSGTSSSPIPAETHPK